ncbi:hypothetical protein BCUN_1929 [Bifidobacterium cuniculi]|uniref:Uncharacterized protein n=2 Tax=Bifidobacterium cuniculi TaxID=1688 RepID=A0A087AHS8_9BIFI|nr:hypothetical protein BCUN_1929 [Bifidobacterium cuniculi]
MNCEQCGKPLPARYGKGRPAHYCSDSCKQAAYRKRKASRMTKNRPHDLDADAFASMADGRFIDVLRVVRDRLMAVFMAEDTPATAIAPISRSLVDVAKQIDDIHAAEDAAAGEIAAAMKDTAEDAGEFNMNDI